MNSSVVCKCSELTTVSVMDDVNDLLVDKDWGSYFSGNALDALSKLEWWKSIVIWMMILTTTSYFVSIIWGFRKDR